MDPRTNYTFMANGTLEGAAVLGIDVEHGITDRGTVVHAKNTWSDAPVRRALSINDTLYTLSRNDLVISDLRNVSRQYGRIRLS